jgi:diaminopimelate epimerase
MRRWSFAKGHGTENDFVLLLDREGVLALGDPEVRFLCNRHAGIGGDGLLRAVLARNARDWNDQSADPDLWFMDYRNSDGSVAEMCGNGLRVFARFLLDEGLASGPEFGVATRVGLRQVRVLDDGRLRVAIGPARLMDLDVTVTTSDHRSYRAVSVDVGNPHAVSFVEDLAAVPLDHEPSWTPVEAFPAGVNREFVSLRGDRSLAMRVFERGSGETRSCGTGTVAVAAAAAARDGGLGRLPAMYRVDTPGGEVEVELRLEESYLTGPAVIVAHGEVAVPGPFRKHSSLEED